MQLPNHFTLNHKHTHHDIYARSLVHHALRSLVSQAVSRLDNMAGASTSPGASEDIIEQNDAKDEELLQRSSRSPASTSVIQRQRNNSSEQVEWPTLLTLAR